MQGLGPIIFSKNINPSFGSSARGDKESPKKDEGMQIEDIPSVPQPYLGAAKGAKRTTMQVCDEIYAPLVKTQNGKKGLEILKGLSDKFARKIYNGRVYDKTSFTIFLDSLDEKRLTTLGENVKILNTLDGDYDYIVEKIFAFMMPKILERDPKKLEGSLNTLKALEQSDLDLTSRGGINDFIGGTNYSNDESRAAFLKSYKRFQLGCQEMCITPEQGFNMLIDKMIEAEGKKED